MFRLSFELVDPDQVYKYCTPPTRLCRTHQIVPNSAIPDEDWIATYRNTDDPWQQFDTLTKWDRLDIEFVRNIKLEAITTSNGVLYGDNGRVSGDSPTHDNR